MDLLDLRILIVTAGFGDGHNSAANNLVKILSGMAEVKVVDPCERAAPVLNRVLQKMYRMTTTYFPKVWERVYYSVEKRDFSKKHFGFMNKPEKDLQHVLEIFLPHLIISTYPLYPYFIERAFKKGVGKVPVLTLITDSVQINASWRNAPTDYFLVSDYFTKKILEEKNIDSQKIIVTGFAVSPKFKKLNSISVEDSCKIFKVLYFPTARKPVLYRYLKSILRIQSSNIRITIVLGRNVRNLYEKARKLQREYPGRVFIKGWTRNVPELLSSHHLVIGKAGGATVHESIAATCPMLIHHLVPGQEEGNLTLLKKIKAGDLTETAEKIATAISEMIKNDALIWGDMKRNLEKYKFQNRFTTIDEFILKLITSNEFLTKKK